jgi:plastocyanin
MRRLALSLVVLALAGAAVTSPSAAPTGTLRAVVKDESGATVGDAVVSLTAAGATAPPARGERAVMDQVDKQFTPQVLPVTAGTQVTFPNRDNIRHHVYSFSAPKKFELPLYIGTPATPIVFDTPGVVVLGCNIHDWMVGYVYVLATPHFAKTGADGTARLATPPGRYEARVWHPRMRAEIDRTARPVTVASGETAEVAFVLSLRRERQVPRGPGRYEGVQGGG